MDGESIPEAEIRARIRLRLRNDALPCDPPERVWAGNGTGTRCAACHEAITTSDVGPEPSLSPALPPDLAGGVRAGNRLLD